MIWAGSGDAPPPAQPSLPSAQPAPGRRRFRVASVRLLVGLERASSVAGYRSTSMPRGAEVVTRGVEASIVGDPKQEAFTPLLLPRLSLDTRWPNGVSLGVAFSYAARSSERSRDERQNTLPSSESALLGPRIGWLKPLSNEVAVWLRGGPTWALRASSEPGSGLGERRIFTERQWAMSLEPQLVVMPYPHWGLSLGAAFDLGFDGEAKVTHRGGAEPGSSRVREIVSTYGVTVGLLGLF